MRKILRLLPVLLLLLACFALAPARHASANSTIGQYTSCGWGGSCVLGIHAAGTDQTWGRVWHETYDPYSGRYSYWATGWNGNYTCQGFGACYNEFRYYATGWNDHIYYVEATSSNGTAWFGYVGP
jgi:hypothetical protein